jgi:DNA-directed RNA polymerase sigma subunit (sigma70/sigma32)
VNDPTDIPAEVWNEFYKDLTELDAVVVRLRFGLDGESPQTVTEIAKTLNLSREHVRKIEENVLQRLAKLRDRHGPAADD